MDRGKGNYREEEDEQFIKGDQIHENGENLQIKKPVKKQFILRRRIDEEIKNSKQYISPSGKLLQPQPQIKKKSFQQMAKLASQQQKITSMLPNMKRSITPQSGLNENKPRDTIFSQQSIGDNFHQKHDDKHNAAPVEDEYIPEVNGPQVQVDKKDVSFIVNTGLVAFEYVNVRNNGSASIYYEWKRVEITRTYSSTLIDPEQKFFCHHEQNVIKPGQSKRFVFAFMSKMTGIFFEEWELKCEPPTTIPISRVKLTGNSIEVDCLKEWRKEFDRESLSHYLNKGMNEIVSDIIDQVRTPTPPLPDLNDPHICAIEFEEKNQDLHLWYNPLVIKWWRTLEQDLYAELRLNPEQQYWDLNINYIHGLIEMVADEDNQIFFESRFATYIELSKQKPVERSQIYPQVREFIQKLACGIPVISDKLKEEIGMWDYVFRPPLNERDFTEQEIKIFEDEKQKIKAEWIKKSKKKKWTEEDDKKMIDDYRNALSNKISQEVYAFFDGFEEKDSYSRALDTIQSRKQVPSVEYFESFLHKKPIKDLDIEGKRIMVKVHLKISSDPGTEDKKLLHVQRLIHEKEEDLKRIEEEKILQEKHAKEKKKVAKKPPPTVVKGKGQKQAVEEEKPQEKVMDVSFLDEDNLQDIVDCVKYLLERQAKQVIMMVSYDIPLGEFRFTSSVKFFAEYMKKQLENPVAFNESIYIDNFEEKIETESFPDNSVLILENTYFVPEEIGFKILQDTENDEAPSLMKYTLEDKSHFISTLSSYCPSLVIEDKENLFSRMTSLINMKFENQVLGQRLSSDLQQVSHMISFAKNPFHVFIGGPLNWSKLISIDTLAFHANLIHLYGEIGIKFLIVQQDILQEEKLMQGNSIGSSNVVLSSGQRSLQSNLGQSTENIILNMPFIGFTLTPIEKIAIRGVLSAIKSRGKALIVFPQDFVIVPDSNVEGTEKYSSVWLEKQIAFAQNYPPRVANQTGQSSEHVRRQTGVERRSQSLVADNIQMGENQQEYDEDKDILLRQTKDGNQSIVEVDEDQETRFKYDINAAFPVGYVIVDFGEQTQATIRRGVRKAKKIAWFESLSIYSSYIVNEADKCAVKTLYKMQTEKKARLDTVGKDSKEYNYANDVLAFLYGKSLESQLKMIDLRDPKQPNEDALSSNSDKNPNQLHLEDQAEDDLDAIQNLDKPNDDDDNKSIHSTNTAVVKPNTVKVVSDFFAKDSQFIFKILHGTFIEALASAESYSLKSSSNLSDDLSFLDKL